MKTRYSFDAESGLLMDRNGETLGRVVSLTLDSEPAPTTERLGYGVSRSTVGVTTSDPSLQKGSEGIPHTPRPTASGLERVAVLRIWNYWLSITGKKQQLDSKRERIIRNALRLVGEDATKRALLGLTRSPFHSGQNDQRKPYMEVRYALKGRGDESDDERIERAISWAAMYAPQAERMDEALVTRLLEDVRYTASLPHRPERDRGNKAARRLKQAGFRLTVLDRAPWVRIER